ncbi:MAG: radical SAM family heme chaperone HemW [Alphaproteobacteria bacterium]
MPSATAQMRSESSSPPASRAEAQAPAQARFPLALYVHWPFCVSKCPYCDFNSHVREGVDQVRWRAALLAELDHFGALSRGRPLTSIFFGGGTPSLMEAGTVAALIERAAETWEFADDIEITLEANPSSAERARFCEYRSAGVNRVSIGVQSFDDEALRFLGRAHDAREALAAIDAARAVFPRTSFDLIYARPGQSESAWRGELMQALSLGTEHLSLYQLTIEEGTPFQGAVARGELRPVSEDRAAALFDLTQDMTAGAGLPAYEVSNHARPGAESRHNLTYWRYGEYVGVGPGAHGRLVLADEEGRTSKASIRQIRTPEAWLAAVERDGHATRETARLSQRERAEEMLMMGLRIARGVDLHDFARETGRPLRDWIERPRLDRILEGRFLTMDETSLRATPKGMRRLNAVLASLLA